MAGSPDEDQEGHQPWHQSCKLSCRCSPPRQRSAAPCRAAQHDVQSGPTLQIFRVEQYVDGCAEDDEQSSQQGQEYHGDNCAEADESESKEQCIERGDCSL